MVMFFNRDWNYINNKNSLSAVIEISGIEARYIGVHYHDSQSFEGIAYERLSEVSVAQQLS
jgi:hypothetical protein